MRIAFWRDREPQLEAPPDLPGSEVLRRARLLGPDDVDRLFGIARALDLGPLRARYFGRLPVDLSSEPGEIKRALSALERRLTRGARDLVRREVAEALAAPTGGRAGAPGDPSRRRTFIRQVAINGSVLVGFVLVVEMANQEWVGTSPIAQGLGVSFIVFAAAVADQLRRPARASVVATAIRTAIYREAYGPQIPPPNAQLFDSAWQLAIVQGKRLQPPRRIDAVARGAAFLGIVAMPLGLGITLLPGQRVIYGLNAAEVIAFSGLALIFVAFVLGVAGFIFGWLRPPSAPTSA